MSAEGQATRVDSRGRYIVEARNTVGTYRDRLILVVCPESDCRLRIRHADGVEMVVPKGDVKELC